MQIIYGLRRLWAGGPRASNLGKGLNLKLKSARRPMGWNGRTDEHHEAGMFFYEKPEQETDIRCATRIPQIRRRMGALRVFIRANPRLNWASDPIAPVNRARENEHLSAV